MGPLYWVAGSPPTLHATIMLTRYSLAENFQVFTSHVFTCIFQCLTRLSVVLPYWRGDPEPVYCTQTELPKVPSFPRKFHLCIMWFQNMNTMYLLALVSGYTTLTRSNKKMNLQSKPVKNSNMFHVSASNEIGSKERGTLLAAISPGRTFPLPGTLLRHPGWSWWLRDPDTNRPVRV